MTDSPKRRNHFNKAEQYRKEKIRNKRVRRIKRINLERALAKQYADQLLPKTDDSQAVNKQNRHTITEHQIALETISTKYSLKLDDEMLKIDIKKYPNDGMDDKESKPFDPSSLVFKR